MDRPTKGKHLCRVKVSPNKVLHLPRNSRDPSNRYTGASFVAVLLGYQIGNNNIKILKDIKNTAP